MNYVDCSDHGLAGSTASLRSVQVFISFVSKFASRMSLFNSQLRATSEYISGKEKKGKKPNPTNPPPTKQIKIIKQLMLCNWDVTGS